MTNQALEALSAQGVSVWLDDLSRELLQGGDLERLIRDYSVVGVTSNPTIFASALAKGDRYEEQVRELVAKGADTDQAVFEITTADVRAACDTFAALYESSGHLNGRVSLEVDPRLAHDTDETLAQAKLLWETVDRPNLMIKIPATIEGLPAIRDAIAAGISVNVTLIFSIERYRAVMEAFVEGLEAARAAGLELAEIQSVASFFVSRVDSEIDKRLNDIEGGAEFKGKAGIANARLAYQAYEEVFSTARWAALAEVGARAQRPLWASTGVKDPNYPDTMYVTELVAPNTVNTMPGGTLDAVADHGVVTGDTIRPNYDDAHALLNRLEEIGVSYNDVVALLETEAVEKFEKSWGELLETVTGELDRVKVQTEGDK